MSSLKLLKWLIGVSLSLLFLVGCGAPSTESASDAAAASSTPVPPALTFTSVPLPTTTADPLVTVKLKSKDPIEKAIAAQQIAASGVYPDGAIEALIECLDDFTRLIPSDKVPVVPPGPFSRNPDETSPSQQCENALIRIGEPAVEPLLSALARYGEGWHREKISESLGLIGDARALPPLIDLLNKGSVSSVAVAVARLGGEKASDALMNAFNTVENASAHSNLVYALGYSKDKRFLPVLLDLVADKDRGVKLNAIMALGYLGNTGAVPALVKLLQDTDLHARWYSCEALGEIGDPNAILPLQELLSREQESVVRDAAADALDKIGK